MKTAKLKKLFRRYLRGRASKAEKYVVDRWYESLIEDAGSLRQANDPQRIQFLKQRIIGRVVNDDDSPRIWYRRPWPRMAAAAVVLCCISWPLAIYLQNDSSSTRSQSGYHVMLTGVNQLKRLTLPDSTEIFLNANSVLEMPKDFGQKERVVRLSGEAYFDVEPDNLRPFRILVDSLEIKVLGTSFNVNAYKQLEYINVSVSSGRIQLVDKHHALATLSANEQLAYHKETAQFELHTLLSSNESSWRNGVSVLRQASFKELALVMYNSYGVNLESVDESVIHTLYNFTVRSTRTLEQTMAQLTEMIQKKYRKEGERIIIY
ncbi:FecR family protein [Olivibacter sitiensis]|uniref:FecR family protein n=1 Tax=Olivibacter sitiensis TaxID=376470 RepID=UPI00041977C9|nr:FecR family protein [Olivibacter sitiensis]